MQKSKLKTTNRKREKFMKKRIKILIFSLLIFVLPSIISLYWSNSVNSNSNVESRRSSGDLSALSDQHQTSSQSYSFFKDPQSSASSGNVPWGFRINFPNDPTKSAAIIWFTNNEPIDHQFKYGTSQGSYELSSQIKYELQEDKYINHVNLDGLTPDTIYYFIAGSDLDGWCSEGSFRTAPLPKSRGIHFGAFGDSRSNRDARKSVGELILSEAPKISGSLPEFMLHTGDIVSKGGEIDLWHNYFEDMNDLYSKVPIYPAVGNHEFSGVTQKWYREQFMLPQNAKTEWYYSFNWGPVHVLSLDSESHGVPPLDQFDEDWLKFDLKQSQKDSNTLWRVAFFHEPYLTSGGHSERDDLRERWAPLFEQYNVDIVFNGHNHNYERMFPVNSQKEIITTEQFDYVNLTVPIVITTGSAGMGNIYETPTHPRPYSILFNGSYHYSDINISIDTVKKITTMTVKIIATSNVSDPIGNSFIMDNFTITKPIPEAYLTQPVAKINYYYTQGFDNTAIIILGVSIAAILVIVDVIIIRKRKNALKTMTRA